MNQSNLKNMVVFKNIPSNLVEEAIIILKANTRIRKPERIEKNKNTENVKQSKKENDYILKEAEMLVNSYVSRLEKKKEEKKNQNINLSKKYIRLKKYAYIASFVLIIESILLIIK